ncbi:phosphodiester glycosidase family protein [Paenibacillus sp. T1]|uniref:Phosphodiester glycosidase family protein n=2 Tax=Paenibacillus glycinis TaxID=2697035 RepID=A0ABW9XV62_9BACL|nr:phosphodiester glycosidase family protein [Paenibacillus glycinis]
MGVQLPAGRKLKLSAPVQVLYATGNPAVAKVNAAGVLTPVAPGRTTLTISVSPASAGYAGALKLPVTVAKPAMPVKLAFEPKLEARTVKIAGRSFAVRTVTIPKGMPVTAGYANRRIGTTQSLAGIASAYQADIAINGAFFDSYSGIPDPYGMLISGGQPAHIGNTGTTIGFKWDGGAVMDTLRLSINGTVSAADGRTRSWYAYFMNRLPTGQSAATLFTPQRGKTLGFAAENAVVVQRGVVTAIRHGADAAIPADGFVIVYQGGEAGQAERFSVGASVSYTLRTTNLIGASVDWSGVHTAVGAGPRLVADGKVALDAAAEGFRDPKILTGGGARSGIAIRRDGSILIATVPGATMKQWAEIMLQLGAGQAMNLDGGASSGMLFQGRTVTQPGRALSNALLFGKQLRY